MGGDTHTRINAVIAATASLASKQCREPALGFCLANRAENL